MKIQQMPSRKGKVLYFIYLPKQVMEELNLKKGVELSYEVDKANKSMILSK